jgi:hypothetical protein
MGVAGLAGSWSMCGFEAALTHAGHHAFHAAHHLGQATFAHHFHHFLRLLELVKQFVDLLHLHPRASGNAAFSAGFDQVGLAAFERGHAVDDALDAVD